MTLSDPAHRPHPSGPPTVVADFRLAQRAASFTRSPWAAIAALLDRHPDMIYFGSGMPARELLPAERLAEASKIAWQDAPAALEYGDDPGWQPLRAYIAERMAKQQMEVDPEQILVTNGSQQGLDLLTKLFVEPGETIALEGPTYLGALQTFAAYEASYLIIPVDEQGMRVDFLADALAEQPEETHPKLIYTVPTFQNPAGVTMSQERRTALIALSRRYGIPIVEDDPYGELRYDGTPLPPLRALDPAVFYLGTFSKTMAPGLRVGWIAAPQELIPLLVAARESTDLHNERITMRTIYHAANGFLDDHLVHARAAYRERRDAMLDGLRAYFPSSVEWSEPDGGFFIWVTLPGQSADALLPHAADAGVLYLPSSFFYPDHVAPTPADACALRLNFSTLPEPVITEGLNRLGAVVASSQ